VQPVDVEETSATLPQHARDALQRPGFNLEDRLLEQERLYIEAALELSKQNVSEAARLLGINRTTLYSRMDVLQKRQANAAIKEGAS
jgi:DNA-binding NtrC family response regulator